MATGSGKYRTYDVNGVKIAAKLRTAFNGDVGYALGTRSDGRLDPSFHPIAGLLSEYLAAGPHLASVPNGAFEDGLPPWTPVLTAGGTVTLDASNSATGMQSLLLTTVASGDAASAYSGYAPVTGGARINLTLRAKIKSGTPPLAYTVKWYNASKTYVSGSDATGTFSGLTSAGFVESRSVVTAPAAARYGVVYVTSTASSSGTVGAVQIDEVRFGRSPLASEISVLSLTDGTYRGLDALINDEINVRNFGVQGDGVTDDTSDMQNVINYAIANGKSIYIPAGTYVLSGALTVDYSSDTTGTGKRMSIRGDGPRATLLNFGAGNYNGLSILGGNDAGGNGMQSYQAVVGLTLNKGDAQGSGLVLAHMAHAEVRNVRCTQWNHGVYATDIISGKFDNLNCLFNYFGGRFARVDFTNPNALTFINCTFGQNFNNGLDVLSPTTFVYIGGSIESNSPGGHTIDTTQQWGLRLVYTSASVDGYVGALLMGVYLDSSQGIADVYWSNAYIGAALTLIGCSFQRHAGAATNCVKFETGGSGNKQSLTAMGCSFFSASDYTPSSATPYIGFPSPSDQWEFNDLGTYYGSGVEYPPTVRAVSSANATSACGVINSDGSIVDQHNIASVAHTGTGTYRVVFTKSLPNFVSPSVQVTARGNVAIGFDAGPTVVSGRYTAANVAFYNLQGNPVDTAFNIDVKRGAGNY